MKIKLNNNHMKICQSEVVVAHSINPSEPDIVTCVINVGTCSFLKTKPTTIVNVSEAAYSLSVVQR